MSTKVLLIEIIIHFKVSITNDKTNKFNICFI